jgi:hypothetical protein
MYLVRDTQAAFYFLVLFYSPSGFFKSISVRYLCEWRIRMKFKGRAEASRLTSEPSSR